MVYNNTYKCISCDFKTDEIDNCEVVYNDDNQSEIDTIYCPDCGEEVVIE